MVKDNRLNVINILGSGHSGSTLLSLLLAKNSDVVTIGEAEKIGIKYVHSKTTCSCGNNFDECPFWNGFVADHEVFLKKGVRHIKQTKGDFLANNDSVRFIAKQTDKVDVEEYVHFNEEMYQHVLYESGSKVVVDSTKNPDRVNVISKYSDHIKYTVVHLVRDGRGVAWSYAKKYNNPFFAMFHWLTLNLKIEILKKRLRDHQVVTVTYEDLVKKPDAVVEKILQTAEPELDARKVENSTSNLHVVGGNVPTIEKGSDIKPDTSWREHLPLLHRSFFNIFFNWMNYSYSKKSKRFLESW